MPKRGIEEIFRAFCEPCKWKGINRTDLGAAKADLDNHKRDAERFMYPCGKLYAKLMAEERRERDFG